jgi:phospholipase C
MTRRLALLVALVALAIAAVAVSGSSAKHKPPKNQTSATHGKAKGKGANRLARIKHIVVIYEENHSFDNLYGGWEGVNGRANADAAHTTQVDQAGNAYGCLKQLDANLTSPPLPGDCTDAAHSITSHFKNTWFTIDDFIKPDFVTCPPTLNAFGFPNGIRNPGINPATGLPVPGALPGGCTRDLVHEFYQEQYQLNHGAQNRYVTGSDSVGTTMGVYDTKQLPIYKYLHGNVNGKSHPHYAILDNFFQGAFGGSFLNHQWLIAAATP